jgi:hypothetical protein
MKTLKIIVLISILFLLILLPKIGLSKKNAEIGYILPEAVSIVNPDAMTVQEMIEYIAPRFNQDPMLISKISYCESHHLVVDHDGGYGLGVTGIHKKTFEGWLPLYQKENGETLDYGSSYDQLKMMSWAFSKGNSYRNQWTTYVAYKRGGEYSFFSKLLQKHFTVYCK